MNTEPFLNLDRVLHEKGRLGIMALLAASSDGLSFTEMRETLEMTDGNLTTHIRTLQEAGYVAVTKSYRDQRPLTTCALTQAGQEAFTRQLDLLAQIVAEARKN